MWKFRIFGAVVLGITVLLSGCSKIPPSVVPTLVCSFANVLVENVDIPEFNEFFGTDAGIGSRACRAIGILLTGDVTGASEPTAIRQPTRLDLLLPNGEILPVTLTPTNR